MDGGVGTMLVRLSDHRPTQSPQAHAPWDAHVFDDEKAAVGHYLIPDCWCRPVRMEPPPWDHTVYLHWNLVA